MSSVVEILEHLGRQDNTWSVSFDEFEAAGKELHLKTKWKVTDSEYEVWAMMALAYDNRKIAQVRVSEVATVHRHISKLYFKLGIHRGCPYSPRIMAVLIYHGIETPLFTKG